MRTMLRKAFWIEGRCGQLTVRLLVLLPPGASLLLVTLRDSLFVARACRRVRRFDLVRGKSGISLLYRLRLAVLPLVSRVNPFYCDLKTHIGPHSFVFYYSARSKRRWTPHRSDVHTNWSYLETVPGCDELRSSNVKSQWAGDSSHPPFVDQDLL